MIIDPIVEELHRQREKYMERFQYDLEAIVEDIRAREAIHTSSPLLQPPAAPPSGTARKVRFSSR